MKKLFNQSGIASWELIVGILVLAIIGVAGYRVEHSKNTATPVSATTTQKTNTNSASVPTAPAVNNTSDLDQATNTLNQVDPTTSNASDSSQLTAQNNF